MIEHFLWGLIFSSTIIFNFEINRAIQREILEEKEKFSKIWNQIELQSQEAITKETNS